MFNTKYRFENILFYDADAISRHLEQMAQKGWMITKISGNLYKYRKTEPKNVKFAVAYFPKVSEYEIYPTEKQRNYLDLCEQMGWQTVILRNQQRILMNEDVNAVEIETDPITQLDNIHATAKKMFVKGRIMSVISMLLILTSRVLSFISDPMNFINDGISIPLVLLAVLCGGKDAVYLFKYIKWHRESVQTAEVLPIKQNKKLRIATTLLGLWLIILLIFRILTSTSRKLFFCMMTVIIVAAFVFEFVKKDQIEMDRTPGDVRFASLLAGIVMFVIGYYGIVTMDTSVTSHLTDKQKAYVEQMYGDMDISAFVRDIWYPADFDEVDGEMKDIFPLEMSDYNPDTRERGQFYYRAFKDCLMPYTEARQQAGGFTMQYSIYNTENLPDWFAQYVAKRTVSANIFLTNKYPELKSTFKQADSSLWKADKVYQQFDSEGYKTGVYIICEDDRIVKIHFESPNILTDERIKLIAEKLEF